MPRCRRLVWNWQRKWGVWWWRVSVRPSKKYIYSFYNIFFLKILKYCPCLLYKFMTHYTVLKRWLKKAHFDTSTILLAYTLDIMVKPSSSYSSISQMFLFFGFNLLFRTSIFFWYTDSIPGLWYLQYGWIVEITGVKGAIIITVIFFLKRCVRQTLVPLRQFLSVYIMFISNWFVALVYFFELPVFL